MAVNLRERAEKDLKFSMEREWALPVIGIDPDGNTLDTNQNTGEPLTGQILYDTVKDNPQTGSPVVINKPAISLRRSSLARIPKAGEKWFWKIPVDPSRTADLETFESDKQRPPEGGRSIGFIRIYLRRVKQS